MVEINYLKTRLKEFNKGKYIEIPKTRARGVRYMV